MILSVLEKQLLKQLLNTTLRLYYPTHADRMSFTKNNNFRFRVEYLKWILKHLLWIISSKGKISFSQEDCYWVKFCNETARLHPDNNLLHVLFEERGEHLYQASNFIFSFFLSLQIVLDDRELTQEDKDILIQQRFSAAFDALRE